MQAFQRSVWSYYRLHRRAFPWRDTRDPYRILVSEIMLQQTQAERVRKFYGPFLKKFPTVRVLAKAPLSEVLRAWQGLGYNRRAKFLRAAAQAIVKDHGGKVPADEAALIALPGIGKNTAGAIMAFAFDLPVVFIETNIRRAFIHHFFADANKKEIEDRVLMVLVEKALDRKRPREWYYALMDYGAMLGQNKALPNPNRRSKTYKRQSAFEGSDRKVRGEIVRILLRQKKLALAELRTLADVPQKRFMSIVSGLQKEGIVKVSRDVAMLAK